MGAVITFPQSSRAREAVSVRAARPHATVIILPVIRIERATGAVAARSEPTKPPPGRKGRGRASRA
jgi:hypothetical protein